ncbi:MAG: AEC family transporter [Coprococcus sp.]|nr:AEC family transporter [Coprococcus sp.]
MENLLFSLNATLPVFFMMLLGLLFRRLGWLDKDFADRLNKFVFQAPLPVLVFSDLAAVDFDKVWNVKFVLFCFGVTVASIAIATAISCVWKDKSIRGEFIQASYRSSAAILGIAFIQNIYGNAGMAPLMIIGSVPLYNVMAVVVLSVFRPGQNEMDSQMIKKTVKGIVTNPIIIAILCGLLWSAFQIPMPAILGKTISSIGGAATPLGLMAMGASIDFSKAFAKGKSALVAAFIKLVGFCILFLPIAVAMGFRREELVAILVMLGSASTVSGFVMARNMGHEGTLSASVVMLTTMLSAFTLTVWLYLLKSMALI